MRHLRPLVVTDARVDMMRTRRTKCENFGLGVNQPLAHDAPVGKITSELERGQFFQNVAGRPGIKKRPAAMRLKTRGDPKFGGNHAAAPKKSMLWLLPHASQPAMTVRKFGAHSTAICACRLNDSRCLNGVAERSGT